VRSIGENKNSPNRRQQQRGVEEDEEENNYGEKGLRFGEERGYI